MIELLAVGASVVISIGVIWYYRSISAEVASIRNNVEQALAEDEVEYNEMK